MYEECGCEEPYHMEECGCGCHKSHHRYRHFGMRRFFTKQEKINKLENYAEDLKKELAAVQERIKELKGR